MIISIALGLVGESLPLGTNESFTKDPPKGGSFCSTGTSHTHNPGTLGNRRELPVYNSGD